MSRAREELGPSGMALTPGSVYAWRVAVTKRFFLALAFATSLLALPFGAAADTDAARRAEDIASRTMSPFCPGRTLASCPSPSAAEWRHDIRRWADQGLTTEEIRARLEERVPGRDLSGAPRAPGGWMLPMVLVALSALVLVAILRRLSRARKADTTPSSTPPKSEPKSRSELDDRLDEELEDIDD